MHNPPGGIPATVAALPTIINFYRDRGYTFVDLNGRFADRPVTGDWDGNGTETPGVVRGTTGTCATATPPDLPTWCSVYGDPTDCAITGDWDGNGTTTPAWSGGTPGICSTPHAAVQRDISFVYGRSDGPPVTGDWDGNGTVTLGVVRGNTWYLRNANRGGTADISFDLGDPRISPSPVTGTATAGDAGVLRGRTGTCQRQPSGAADQARLRR